MALAVAALLLLGAFLIILAPLVLGVAAREAPRPGAELEARREWLLSDQKELDLDLAMGKVAPDDHAAVKRSLEDETVTVMALLDRERGPGESTGPA